MNRRRGDQGGILHDYFAIFDASARAFGEIVKGMVQDFNFIGQEAVRLGHEMHTKALPGETLGENPKQNLQQAPNAPNITPLPRQPNRKSEEPEQNVDDPSKSRTTAQILHFFTPQTGHGRDVDGHDR